MFTCACVERAEVDGGVILCGALSYFRRWPLAEPKVCPFR